MKAISFMILMSCVHMAYGQDGSDIIYTDVQKIDDSYIGKYIQIDFYNDSFGSHDSPRRISSYSRKADTVSLNFQGFERFKEIRNDTGFNNWFYEQYMVSIEQKNGRRLRIKKMKLLNVSKDSLEVKLFALYYQNGKEVFSRYLTAVRQISKKDIFKVLVHAKPPVRDGLSIYQVYDYPPDLSTDEKKDCYYCSAVTDESLSDYPLVSDWQIQQFDFKNQRISLNKGAQRDVQKLDIPQKGMPVALTLDGEIIYVFWLWNVSSSFGCDAVYSIQDVDLKLRYGFSTDPVSGADPRYDKRLEAYSILKNK